MAASGTDESRAPSWLSAYVDESRAAGTLALQPRMGFKSVGAMRNALGRVKSLPGRRIGTITVDSFTRLHLYESARLGLEDKVELNGYPIVAQRAATAGMLEGLCTEDFPVQVRHGSPRPREILLAAAEASIDATEGGPISYCLPYSQVPLSTSVDEWAQGARFWANHGANLGRAAHIESFGGCMLGQLCPPSMLIAITVLEGLFFIEHGIRDLSLSLTQGTNAEQDLAAFAVLRAQAKKRLPIDRWHIVFYTYMGLFCRTQRGCRRILKDSVRIASAGGAGRLIVKTAVESQKSATIEDNLSAMNWARAAVESETDDTLPHPSQTLVDTLESECDAIIASVLVLDDDLSIAIRKAFSLGILDIPYCLHPDNANRVRAALDPETGMLHWIKRGHVPIPKDALWSITAPRISAQKLLEDLSYVRRRYDGEIG